MTMCVRNHLQLAMDEDLDVEIMSKRRRRSQLAAASRDHRQITGMDLIPMEIVVGILSRLPITCLVQFRFVCKSWRALTQDPFLANSHLLCSAQTNPCLILHCDSPIRNQLYFVDLSTDENKVKKLHIPFQSTMPEFDVVGSCNGLLCLSDSLYHDTLYVHNPFTMDFMELPKSKQYPPNQEIVIGFGFHPKTKEYKLVKIVYYKKSSTSCSSRGRYPQSDVEVFTLGGSTCWKSLGKIAYQLVLGRPSEAALIDGRLHWVSKPRRHDPARRIISFDLADEEFHEVQKPECGVLNRCNYQLVVLKGCLAAAVFRNYGKSLSEIWVMKEYDVKESWVKAFRIGSYMPKGLKQQNHLHTRRNNAKIWRNSSSSSSSVVRILCILDNGEILLEYKNRMLVSYDPKTEKFKDFSFQGIPNWFHATVHVGSLSWIPSLSRTPQPQQASLTI